MWEALAEVILLSNGPVQERSYFFSKLNETQTRKLCLNGRREQGETELHF